jgi:hypothetical protein
MNVILAAAHVARPETLVWALSAIALMQIPYWTRRRVVPALPQVIPNAPFGHILLFMANFVFGVAMIFFAFAFIEQPPGFHMPMFRYAVTIAALFSLFCYMQELQGLGERMMGREKT